MSGSIPYANATSETLSDVDRQALAFLAERNGDCIGEIDTDEKLAAAVVFSGLVRRGLAMAAAGADEQPTFYITTAGRDALAKPTPSPEEAGR